MSPILRLVLRIATLFQTYFSCVLSCVVLVAIGSNISSHTCQPQFPHANPMPTCTLAHMLHTMQDSCHFSCWHRCCTPAKPVPTLDMARMLHPMQNTCQLWTCKSRATSYPQVIHRLPHAKPVPTLRPSKTRANFRHAKVVPMLGRGRGLRLSNYCSSHSGTKKVKTRKKEP